MARNPNHPARQIVNGLLGPQPGAATFRQGDVDKVVEAVHCTVDHIESIEAKVASQAETIAAQSRTIAALQAGVAALKPAA